MVATAVADGLFVMKGDQPHLIAAKRKSDGRVRFPMPKGPEAALYDPVELPADGTLWSYTVQRFRPKTPPYIGADDDATFQPFALGYIEFPGQVIVEGRILTDDVSSLRIGRPMRTVIEPFPTSTRGEVNNFAFKPAD
jgi:uncharacterized OB-fold protein